MGLLDAAGMGGSPFAQWFDQNRGRIMGLGTGLTGAGNDPRMLSQGINAGLQHGVSVDQENAIIRAKQAEDQRKIAEEQSNQNATIQWLQQKYPQYAKLPAAEGFQLAMNAEKQAQDKANGGGMEAPANIREWEYFNKLSDPDKAAYIRMKRANPYLDIGTGFVQPDPINPGQPAGPAIAKDNFTPAYDSAAGGATAKVDAANKDAFDSLNSKLPGLKSVVGELSGLAKTATYTATGQLIDGAMRQAGMEPSEAAVARTKYMAMVDNQVLPLLRDTFGAAFTVQEGESLRATLGAPDKSPAEKQVVLEAFIEQKVRDLDAMRSRLPPTSAAAAPPAASGGVVDFSTYFGGQ